MISIILSVLAGIVCSLAYSALDNATWGIYVAGLFGTIISFVIINRWKQKPLQEIMMRMQMKLQETQQQIQKKANHMQSRGGGNPAALQKTAEKMTAKATEEALEILKEAEQFYKWNFLIEKQIDTYRFQLNYQIKNFEEVDKYIDKVMLLDASVITMKMARLYKKNTIDREALKDDAAKKKALKDWAVTKVYNKGKGRVKGANAKLIYTTYAWMLNKLGLIDEALAVLIEGQNKTACEIMAQNVDRLRNNKPKSFSNVKYGDVWYALFLEEPPKVKQKMKRQNPRNAGRPF